MTESTAGIWLQVGSLAWGTACAWSTVLALDAIRAADARPRRLEDEDRRRRLRASSRWYAATAPAVDALAAWTAGRAAGARLWVGRMLVASGEDDWTPEEFLAYKAIQGLAATAVGVLLSVLRSSGPLETLAAAVVGFALWCAGAAWSLKGRAERRRARIAARLPFAVDLVALVLEAGGRLLGAIETVLQEMERHPLADELGRVHRSIRLGVPPNEALERFRDRVGLPAVDELVSTIIQGEAGGVPIASLFRSQAEQMRLKRSQAVEKAVAKAHVHMVYPGLISMLACLLIMAAQFLIWMASLGGPPSL
jgi:tight adherence protein C